mgnify:CR=1 FL=1
MPDAALARRIRALLAESPFHGDGHRKVRPRLRRAGVPTGPRRVLRVMRERGLLAHQRPGSPRGPRVHDGTITAAREDETWRTDLATVATGEGPAAVFVAVDHGSAECVGIHAGPRATRHEAPEPIRRAVRGSFGAVGKGAARGVSIRHDHGSQYMSADFQREIRFLGARSSPAFVRAPEGDGRAERFIRTPKESLLRVRRFETIEELRRAILEFQPTCNEHWLIERHGHRPPAAIRRGQTVSLQTDAQPKIPSQDRGRVQRRRPTAGARSSAWMTSPVPAPRQAALPRTIGTIDQGRRDGGPTSWAFGNSFGPLAVMPSRPDEDGVVRLVGAMPIEADEWRPRDRCMPIETVADLDAPAAEAQSLVPGAADP